MAFGSMLTKNLTGTVDKAYILLHRPLDEPKMSEAAEGKAVGYYLKKLSSLGESLANTASQAAGQEANLSQSLTSIMEEGTLYPLKVQYNPSTLHFSSRGGKSFNRYSGVGGNGSGQFQIDDVPCEIVLNMDLIFDDTVNSDAFSVMDAGNASWTGAAKAVASAVSGTEHSVQNISELFVAAITNAYSRAVCVVWNKSIFWGELCAVTVEYTMFNTKGNPIRSRVHLEIRQDERGYSSDDYWETTYNNFFDAAEDLQSSMKLTASSNIVSNIFNFNN